MGEIYRCVASPWGAAPSCSWWRLGHHHRGARLRAISAAMRLARSAFSSATPIISRCRPAPSPSSFAHGTSPRFARILLILIAVAFAVQCRCRHLPFRGRMEMVARALDLCRRNADRVGRGGPRPGTGECAVDPLRRGAVAFPGAILRRLERGDLGLARRSRRLGRRTEVLGLGPSSFVMPGRSAWHPRIDPHRRRGWPGQARP